jgi:predicted DNA-binding protein
MMTKGFKTLNLDVEAMNRLDTIAKVLNRHKSQIIKEFVNNLYEVVGSFQVGNISYETRITQNLVYIYVQVSGRSRLIHGTAYSEEEMQKQIDEQLKKGELEK